MTALGGILVLALWSIGGGILAERRIVHWYAARGRNEPRRTALLVVATHLVSLVAWLLVAVLGTTLADAGGGNRWAGWVVVPWLLVYLPWLLQFLPGQYSGFKPSRRDAEASGMSRSTARAMFWTGAPFSLLGLSLAFGALLATFAS